MRWSRKRSLRLLGSLPVGGILVGLCATQALDWLSSLLYDFENGRLRAEENAARGDLHAYERGVLNLTRPLGIKLDRAEIEVWGLRLHKVFGVLGGIGYLAMRRANERVGLGRGLAFGTALFLVADELLMPLLKLTPGPRAFSWKVHARGAAAHVAYGVAAESAARALEHVTA